MLPKKSFQNIGEIEIKLEIFTEVIGRCPLKNCDSCYGWKKFTMKIIQNVSIPRGAGAVAG